MAKVIGIDLGTTMSAMACVDEKLGQPVIIPNSDGDHLTPSVILISDTERVVGKSAKRAARARPESVVQFIKRKMSDPDHVFTDPAGRQHRPEELSALILKKLKQDAGEALGEEVTQAVITVPAYFADLERRRTRQAGEIAGLDVLDIINEPTAAAIAYNLAKAEEKMTFLVYDLGGGTFDVTVMEVTGLEGVHILTSDGNKYLGGGDFDMTLVKHFIEAFEAQHQINLKQTGDLRTDMDWLERAEEAKKDLSQHTETYVNLTAAGKVLDLTLQRDTFEALLQPSYIDESLYLTERALQDAQRTWADVDKILLVGGSTRIPLVRRLLSEHSGKPLETAFNPDEVVALGAAVYAANLSGITVRNTKGHALPSVRISNVTAHSLGITALEGDEQREVNSKIIPKNSEIPAANKRMYTTVEDNQTTVAIQIIQGEDDDPKYCAKVGEKALLTDIPPRCKGEPQIEVSLEYDHSGIVHLHAKELQSGRELRTNIEYGGLMSSEEVRRAAARVRELNVK